MTNTGLANARSPDRNGWKQRHDTAWKMQEPSLHLRMIDTNAPILHEQAMIAMLKGWQLYANSHAVRFGEPIGNDHFLGPQWLKIGKSLRALLNGETGRLDCGTVDGFILDTLKEHGFGEDDL